jgi:hypothetical protein
MVNLYVERDRGAQKPSYGEKPTTPDQIIWECQVAMLDS